MKLTSRFAKGVAFIYALVIAGLLGFNLFQALVIIALFYIVNYIRIEKRLAQEKQVEETNAHIKDVEGRYDSPD